MRWTRSKEIDEMERLITIIRCKAHTHLSAGTVQPLPLYTAILNNKTLRWP